MTARQAALARQDTALTDRAAADAIIARVLAEAPPLGPRTRAALRPMLDVSRTYTEAEPEPPAPRPRRRARRPAPGPRRAP